MTIIAQARIPLGPRRAGRRPIDWPGHRAGSSWPMHGPGSIAAIARGEVDAACIVEPAASVILSQQGARMITNLARESFGPSHRGMRVRDAFVAQHPAAFRAEHERVHGSATAAPVRAVTARLARTVAVARPPAATCDEAGALAPPGHRRAWLAEARGWTAGPICDRASLPNGAALQGPAIREQGVQPDGDARRECV
jgi:N-methylhydantoinase A/oxoprolinase/acetone carboxylase beta subunit